MAIICPFKGRICGECSYHGYDTDRQRKACYYGKSDSEIKEARRALLAYDAAVHAYHMEEAAIGDL